MTQLRRIEDCEYLFEIYFYLKKQNFLWYIVLINPLGVNHVGSFIFVTLFLSRLMTFVDFVFRKMPKNRHSPSLRQQSEKNTSNQSKNYQINQSFHFLTKLNQDCQASKRNHKNLRYRARLICTWFSRMTQLSKLFSCPAGSATDMSETAGPSSSSKIRQITGRLLVGGIDWNKKDKNFIAQ